MDWECSTCFYTISPHSRRWCLQKNIGNYATNVMQKRESLMCIVHILCILHFPGHMHTCTAFMLSMLFIAFPHQSPLHLHTPFLCYWKGIVAPFVCLAAVTQNSSQHQR